MLPSFSIRYIFIVSPLNIDLLRNENSALQLLNFLCFFYIAPLSIPSRIENLQFSTWFLLACSDTRQQSISNNKKTQPELSWLLLVHTKKMMFGESEWKILREHLQHNLTERYDDKNGGGRRWRWRWWTSTEYKVKMRMMEIWSLRNDEAVRGRRHVIKIDR